MQIHLRKYEIYQIIELLRKKELNKMYESLIGDWFWALE